MRSMRIVTAVLLGLVVAGCAGATRAEPIKIGVLQPLTGPVSAAGTAIWSAIQIAAEEINAAGGINGRPIQLVVEDTRNDPATCTSAAEKIITRDKVVGIIGAWGSSCTLAVAPVVGREKVPMVVETSSSYKVTKEGEGWNPYIFRLSPPTAMEAEALRGHVKALGMNKVFFLSVNNDWGRGSRLAYGPIIEAEGGQVVGEALFGQEETNFQPHLTRVKGSGADWIIITTDAAQIALILEQANALGLKQKVLTSGGSNFPAKVLHLSKGVGAGHYATVFYGAAFDPKLSADPARASQFNQKWKQKGYEWIEIGEAARGYDAMYVLAEALKGAARIDREALREALGKVQMKGIMYGNIRFTDWTGPNMVLKQQNVPPVYILHVKGPEQVEVVIQWPK